MAPRVRCGEPELGCLPQSQSTLFWGNLSLSLEFGILLHLQAKTPQDPPVPSSPALGLQARTMTLGFHVGAED